MAISLRVVGIFYRNTVDLGVGSMSVRDLVDASVSDPGAGVAFSYSNTIINGINSPSYFSATYQNSFVSSLSGLTYDPGTYELQEVLTTRPSYTVWQYYIMDAEGRFVNNGAGLVPYDQATVLDGQSVVWRLLTILAQPSVQAPRFAPTEQKAKALSM